MDLSGLTSVLLRLNVGSAAISCSAVSELPWHAAEGLHRKAVGMKLGLHALLSWGYSAMPFGLLLLDRDLGGQEVMQSPLQTACLICQTSHLQVALIRPLLLQQLLLSGLVAGLGGRGSVGKLTTLKPSSCRKSRASVPSSRVPHSTKEILADTKQEKQPSPPAGWCGGPQLQPGWQPPPASTASRLLHVMHPAVAASYAAPPQIPMPEATACPRRWTKRMTDRTDLDRFLFCLGLEEAGGLALLLDSRWGKVLEEGIVMILTGQGVQGLSRWAYILWGYISQLRRVMPSICCMVSADMICALKYVRYERSRNMRKGGLLLKIWSHSFSQSDLESTSVRAVDSSPHACASMPPGPAVGHKLHI
ncbi:MAG: hypothetical protein FRX49_03229 [Trebouxia sp. A1-2]|nr:MAG: hypothetical protein FRX49_03229 [Trebouxia sp. A1-2]